MLNRCLAMLFAGSILQFSLCATASAAPNKYLSVPEAAQVKISAVVGNDAPGYYAQPTAAGFSLTNAPQELVADFTSRGVELKQASDRWGFCLQGYGRGERLTSSHPAAPQARLNRLEYRRGMVTEWYVNGPAGLEQGFTLTQRPLQTGQEPLTIALSLSGNLAASADGDGKGVSLSDQFGHARLHYAGLAAHDNTGRELRTWIELRGRQLRLRVDDAGARYPVVVDPTVQLAKLTASDAQTGAWFGYSIAISGSTVVVGAPQASIGSNTYQGAAYVFVKPTSGWANMTQTAKLTASDGAAFAYFGGSVSFDGSTIVVGAFDAYINSVPGVGAAYVYVQPLGGWVNMTETAKLTASDGFMDNFFGYSVAISGSTVVVGEPRSAVGTAYDVGAAYVFVEPSAGWASMTQTAKLTSNGSNGDQFGTAVAINGGTIAIGAPYAAISGNWDQGAAYVFVEPTGGWVNMTPTAELTVSGGLANQYFGMSVATNGTVVAAGAPGLNSYVGAAFVFVKPTGGWGNTTQTAQLTASAGLAGDLLGTSVAMSGNTIVAGASHAQIGTNAWSGAVYMFLMPSGGWTNMTQNVRLTVSHGAAYQDLGGSVSISGNTVVAGAFGVTSYTGAGYVYGNSAKKVPPTKVGVGPGF